MARHTEKEILDLLKERILVLDGAMGTNLQKQNLTEEDFGGADYYGCNEYLVITKPEAIERIHREFLEAGADIIESCTFGSTPLVLEEYRLGDRAYEISRKGAELARRVADQFETPDRPRFVAGSIGPTTRSLSVTGGVTFDELVENFYIQAKGLMDGEVDLFLLETAQDTLNLKAAAQAVLRLREETKIRIPVMISGTIESNGTMLAGQGVESLVTSLEHLEPLSFGINCGTGPLPMTDHIRSIAKITSSFVSCYPNAGMPDENGHYLESPKQLAAEMRNFLEHGWINIMGGCCGTTPDHIRELAKVAAEAKPRVPVHTEHSRVSGIDFLPIEEEGRPYLVGERTNSLGSRKFRELIAGGLYDEAAEIGKQQVKGGAHIIDVCLQNPDRDEREDMEKFLPLLLKQIRAPLMIDTTNIGVLEQALKYSQGKVIYNSVNLENGEDRFRQAAELYHHYGFAMVVGTIDDDPVHGMGLTVERKLAIAGKSYRLLTEKYGILPEDIIFDPLVFPVATGDTQYIGSAEQTIRGVEAIKKAFPKSHTILGLSNVSFGLPVAGREVLNSVFLYHNVKAGLDFAIVNAEKLVRYPSLDARERELAERLIFHTPETYEKALNEFAAYFKDRKSTSTSHSDLSKLPLEERLARYVVEGSIDGLAEDIDRALQKYRPLEIVNGPLMKGMEEVGRLFNANQLIVAEVLQSAEVMKRAVSRLEPHMEKSESSVRGKFLLATVKGDVHDIGKNLVEIILSNNGYQVINLGIKVPTEQIITAFYEHKPDAIGLSGLLVKSAEQMAVTAEDLQKEGVDVPLFVGGAALSEKFARNKIHPKYGAPVVYAKDAMEGLDLLNRYMNPASRGALVRTWHPEESLGEAGLSSGTPASGAGDRGNAKDGGAPSTEKKTAIREAVKLSYNYGRDGHPNRPEDLGFHRIHPAPAKEIYSLINPGMLYKKHLGFRGDTREAEKNGDSKFLELKRLVSTLQEESYKSGLPGLDGIYRFFRAASDGNDLVILSDDGKRERERFHFNRQKRGEQLCLSDYVAPLSSGIVDHVALFIVTAGVGVREEARRLKEEGQYLRSHALSALALESAEGFAEWIHSKIRSAWGIGDPAGFTARDMFSMRYQGARFSFGYPACPDLEDQEKLFRLLELPEDFGVQLTEGCSMDPEASVSAIVFQHPEAHYFSVLEE